jgi:hypothetical protein
MAKNTHKYTWIKDDYHNPKKSGHGISSLRLQLQGKLHPVKEVHRSKQIGNVTARTIGNCICSSKINYKMQEQ